jgi:hypothetical protein
MPVERGGNGYIESDTGFRESTGQLREEFKSFGRKRIDMSGQVFILLKLSAMILDENCC